MSVLTETTFTNAEDTRAIVEEVALNAFESVCSTMGPNGRYACINENNRPKVTKDGVSVAKALDFNEARRNMIARIITEPAIKTDVEVGDGTTTTIFQMFQLFNAFKDKAGFKEIRFLDEQINEVIDYLGSLIIPGDIKSEEFRRMLMTSSNYEEEIVNQILSIYRDYQNPNVILQRVPALKEDEVVLTKDIFFEGQFGADAFVPSNNRGLGCTPANAVFLLIDANIATIDDETLSMMANSYPDKLVVIIARNFEQNAINVLGQYNHNVNRVAFLPYKLQAGGSLGTNIFNDLANILGGRTVFDIRQSQAPDLIQLKSMVTLRVNGIAISKEDSIVAEAADKILEGLDARYDAMSIVERQQVVGRELFRRLSRLRANNVIIRVTGVTTSDMNERYYRYEDVMKAAKTGLQYGVIPGIGYGYMKAADHLAEQPAQSDEELEKLRQQLIELLRLQYEHLTGIRPGDSDYGKYVDLVTGEISEKPTTVFDNAAATMIALRGGWQTAKTLSKINNVMGRSNQSYS
ncbi:chaperonin groEL [Kosakonia phage Kc263]|uniref:Heat shock protein n=1 Tax=Kosakonia phage Kc263 TaxID=2863194 RepID=A0AAE8BIP0_9CAUD|nr:chaperonin groEL [Kosakonia phage Kc263]QYN80139.1 heat shock protein [Kosakonia phage Kc263]